MLLTTKTFRVDTMLTPFLPPSTSYQAPAHIFHELYWQTDIQLDQ